MAAENDPPSLTEEQLDNIQGDVWSKGFPKFYETYYFFTIKPDNVKLFAQSLKELVTQPNPLISTLRKVKKDQAVIRERKKKAAAVAERSDTPRKDDSLLPIANALIAFTRQGLDAIQAGVVKKSLRLNILRITDPAFYNGMASQKVREKLSDPASTTWDPLFQSPQIHGMLKIAGSSKDEVERHLAMIQTVLKHGTAIEDAFQNQPPTESDSRVTGWTRPNDRGKEHFGFEDGVSQPLMGGIDQLERFGPPNMNTDPNILIVRPTTHHEGETSRPEWMYDGSFVVFRKLEQNVESFEALTDQWQQFHCASKAHMGAKLVGRWQSGAPIVQFPNEDTEDPENDISINDFVYDNQICPISAHIRKTNIREILGNNDRDPRAKRTRIIRKGITYGPDYKEHETDGSTRGLLFVCYQGAIEDGFENMQSSWSNNITFRSGTPGHDPIIGQTPSGILTTEITDTNGEIAGNVEFPQLVTLKGGGYFFAPSMQALRESLSNVSS